MNKHYANGNFLGTSGDIVIKIKYRSPFKLEHAKPGDAGYDISCDKGGVVWGKSSTKFTTGLYLAIPAGYVGKIVSRSGLSFNHGIEVGAGTIDSGYRGEVKIHLHNLSTDKVVFLPGDRIAQLIIIKHEDPWFELSEDLGETERNEGGFGHTGISIDEPMIKRVNPEVFLNGDILHQTS
jgi:dUTP pyrophosphatase